MADTALTHGPPNPNKFVCVIIQSWDSHDTVFRQSWDSHETVLRQSWDSLLLYSSCRLCRHVCSVRWSLSEWRCKRVATWPWPSAYGEGHGKNNLTPQQLMRCSLCSFLRFSLCLSSEEGWGHKINDGVVHICPNPVYCLYRPHLLHGSSFNPSYQVCKVSKK